MSKSLKRYSTLKRCASKSSRASRFVDDAAGCSDGSSDESDGDETVEGLFCAESQECLEPDEVGFHSRLLNSPVGRRNVRPRIDDDDDDDDVVSQSSSRALNGASQSILARPVNPHAAQLEGGLAVHDAASYAAAVAPNVDGLMLESFSVNDQSAKRFGTFSVTFFPEGCNPVRDADGQWSLPLLEQERFFSGGVTHMPDSILRVAKHPTAKICRAEGQYEFAPEKGTFHWQGFVQTMGRGTDKKPTAEYRPTVSTFVRVVRTCHEDDLVMHPVDGFSFAGKPFRIHIEPALDPRSLAKYCTREFNDDGSKKRAFGDSMLWSLNAVMTDEVRNGSSMAQITSLVLGGETPFDVLGRFPGQGLQYWRNINSIASEVHNRKNDLGSLRRCGNKFCGLPVCDELTARSRAERLAISYDEYVALADAPCDVGVMYAYGDAGTGKSSFTKAVALMETKDDVFIKSADSFWGAENGKKYGGEKGLICHDVSAAHFGVGRPFDNFKNVVDCTNLDVPVKGGTVPCLVNKFYFDGNADPCQFFVDMVGDSRHSSFFTQEYPAFVRRIKAIFMYRRSTDGFVSIVGQQMPSTSSFVKTMEARRAWTSSRSSSPIPPFEYLAAIVSSVAETHGTLAARASDRLFEERFFGK